MFGAGGRVGVIISHEEAALDVKEKGCYIEHQNLSCLFFYKVLDLFRLRP
jgi:hypothetical protein